MEYFLRLPGRNELWWRPAVCIPSPLYTGSLLFYNQLQGKVAIGPLSGNGDFETLQDYPDDSAGHEPFQKDWTHMVAANNGLLLFYDKPNGRCLTGQLADDGTYQNLQDYPDDSVGHEPFQKDWTHMVRLQTTVFYYSTMLQVVAVLQDDWMTLVHIKIFRTIQMIL